MDERMNTTAFGIEGTRIVRNHGVVRGITVRSRSVFGTIGASFQTIVGGNITLFTDLCEKTRAEAFEKMLQHVAELGANAVVGIRYDATELMNGVSEVLCYGTAVTVVRDSADKPLQRSTTATTSVPRPRASIDGIDSHGDLAERAAALGRRPTYNHPCVGGPSCGHGPEDQSCAPQPRAARAPGQPAVPRRWGRYR